MRLMNLRFPILALVLVSSALISIPAIASPQGSIDAHLVGSDGDSSRAHVHVIINRPDITEVKVVAFDAAGQAIQRFAVQPQYNGNPRAEVSLEFPDDVKVDSARVTGFTIQSKGKNDPAFETGLLKALPMTGCASFCMAERQACSWSCAQGGMSGEAVFSCGPDGAGGCQSTCECCNYPDCNGP